MNDSSLLGTQKGGGKRQRTWPKLLYFDGKVIRSHHGSRYYRVCWYLSSTAPYMYPYPLSALYQAGPSYHANQLFEPPRNRQKFHIA